MLRELPDCSVDAVVTDPPYGIRFMGKAWDGADIVANTERWRQTNPMPKEVGGPHGGYRSAAAEAGRYQQELGANVQFQHWVTEWASECLRVLKPGGHLLASGSSRTGHRLAAGIEDAGFEIRDSIAWMYGSGFPKSMDVSKAVDKAMGAKREVVGIRNPRCGFYPSPCEGHNDAGKSQVGMTFHRDMTSPATGAGRNWQGWGTALKPAFEPIVVARKPLAGTVAANVLEHGTGALNIDGCRIETTDDLNGGAYAANGNRSESASLHAGSGMNVPGKTADVPFRQPLGRRWPANVVLDEHQAASLDEQSGERKAGGKVTGNQTSRTGDSGIYGAYGAVENSPYGDLGGASRFFYTAKADSNERVRIGGVAHPTVKPLSLMRWLVRLVTPPRGTVLEPFAGSGTTVEACLLEGFACIAIEREADYLPLIIQRLNRRTDPVAAVRAADGDAGLFELLDEGGAA